MFLQEKSLIVFANQNETKKAALQKKSQIDFAFRNLLIPVYNTLTWGNLEYFSILQ